MGSTVGSQPVEDPPAMKFTWTIENFTRFNTKKHYSEEGTNISQGKQCGLPYGWSRYARFSLAVVNQIHTKYSIRNDTQHQFNARESDWGFTSFMPLGDLYDPSRGYLVNDTVVVEAEVVAEKDMAEHLRKRLKKKQEKDYSIIKVARDEDLAEQIGRDIYFDLVDHDKVRSFRIQNQTPFNVFKEEVAKEFGIPVQFQRFWIWAKRQNYTYRPHRPLTAQEELQSVGQLREVPNKAHNAELKLFLEVEFGPDVHPLPPPDKTKEDILLFFKLYEPEKRELRYVGRLFVKSSSKPIEILAKLNLLAGFSPEEEIELYEELKFEPCIMFEHLDKRISFRLSQIEDGDIICFQKSTPVESEEECKYPDVPSFLDYVHNRQIVHFRSLEKPKEEDFSLELSKQHTYDDVVEKVANQIGLEEPTKIRLTAHNCYSQQPKPQPIKYRGLEHLTDMLVHYSHSSDILYYEVLEKPLPELERLKKLKDEVVMHNIRFPKQSTARDVINVKKAAQVTLESMASNVGTETAKEEFETQTDAPKVTKGSLAGPSSLDDDLTLRRLSTAEELLKSSSSSDLISPKLCTSAEALAALETVSLYANGSLSSLCTGGAYEEFTVALKLLTEQGIIPLRISSMLKDLLESLGGEIPKYAAAEKELSQGKELLVQHEDIKARMELAMQKCQKTKDTVANYDAEVAKLKAELARIKGKRAKTMVDLRTAVDEMEPLKQSLADSSSKCESFTVRQAMLTVQKGPSLGTWIVVKDVLKDHLKF